MRVLDKLLGRGDEDGPEIEPLGIEEVARVPKPGKPDVTMLERHERTLQAVQRVLTDSQRRIAVAIDDTGNAIDRQRR